MEIAIQSLDKLRATIASSQNLKDIMNNGEDITPGVTTKPRLNLSALNSETGMNSYITLSFNKVEGYESSASYYLKAGVVTDAVNIDDPATLVLKIVGELNRIITQKDLLFGFAEQYEFGEMEESYFDLDQMTWGYVVIYGNSDVPI